MGREGIYVFSKSITTWTGEYWESIRKHKGNTEKEMVPTLPEPVSCSTMIKCKKQLKYSTNPYIYQNYAKLNNVYLKEIHDT